MRKLVSIFLLAVFIFAAIISLPGNSFAEDVVKPVYKTDLGMNVHWSLDAFDANGKTESFLKNSNTKWVREHFYTEVLDTEDNTAWMKRYDYVMRKYHDMDIKVVGMIAYGPANGDFDVPDMDRFLRFVEFVVSRYKPYVNYWQIWNEPDSASFLTPNNYDAYKKILEPAYDRIKREDPDATVLTAGISYPNKDFIERMYKGSGDKFDILAVHAYYCRAYNANKDNMLLEDGFTGLYNDVIKKYKPNDKIWITEMGCSTSGGIGRGLQKEYLQKKVPWLLSQDYVEKIFLYTYRDRVTASDYENKFGFLTRALEPKPVFWWYSGIYKGPYNQDFVKQDVASEKAVKLRKGLENYFGKGKIPVSAQNWYTITNSYTYGGYPIPAIARAIKFGGKTVHPTIPWKVWKKTNMYKEWIVKNPF